MKFDFKIPEEKDSLQIATWRYEGEYSFYSNDKSEEKRQWALNIHKEKDVFTVFNDEGKLVGHCSFDNEDGEIVLGVQMKPDYTGHGHGYEFVKAIIDFGRYKYRYDKISLYVAKFNKRAIKVYEKLGFNKTDDFEWEIHGVEVEFYVMEKLY